MRAFLISILVALAVAIVGALVLNSVQKDAQVAYKSSTGARI